MLFIIRYKKERFLSFLKRFKKSVNKKKLINNIKKNKYKILKKIK
ncbi:hypothetical protein [Candidatus Carsonella ruddii]|uniref:Uncharacterized protein n=1 Tax=Candidatus Carsonella ruddii PC isolate NHV TaxID=1202540 RepID=J3Z1Z8_CARRU|nr:hypothetical protein [Candidatus Carsonella ruddii]AFP84284.1 hypothetical protein A357_065 [Candidatus Carsonella ruddii PC isolate NHV]